MPKVVINRCYGGFGLSDIALKEYCIRKGVDIIYDFEIPRDDKDLIEIIESMKTTANGRYSELKIVDIPEDVEWQIEEYDGMEYVAEIHRIWS